jgi:polyisoprenoid-binding protein YceI
MRTMSTTLALTLMLAAQALAGDVYTVDRNHSEAAFQVRHILTKVRGPFRDFTGTIDFDKAKPENSGVEFHIKAASIDTGVQRRDDHLRSADFFDVEKFPELTFKSTKVVQKGKTAFDVIGDLTIHGVTRQVVLPVTYLGESGPKAGFETAVTINRKDYGLNWNKTLETGGLMVGDDVEITINVEADKQTPKAETN